MKNAIWRMGNDNGKGLNFDGVAVVLKRREETLRRKETLQFDNFRLNLVERFSDLIAGLVELLLPL